MGVQPPERVADIEMNSDNTSKVVSTESLFPVCSQITLVRVGVAAMRRKLSRAPMQTLLTAFTTAAQCSDVSFEILELDETIMSQPIEQWPHVDVLLALCSDKFPVERVLHYIDNSAPRPFIVNDVEMFSVIRDRRRVMARLREAGVPTPSALIVDRARGDFVVQTADTLHVYTRDGCLRGTIEKPFVEKPVDADDHNVYIYYPGNAGVRKLFRKTRDVSSAWVPGATTVRATGDYVYEKFYAPARCQDVKVYAVGDYFYAEARKAPHVDGIVERDAAGLERRVRVKLDDHEIKLCRRVSDAFGQFINGFDLLRVPGRGTFVIDVNGWSFVKRQSEYVPTCAKMLVSSILYNVHRCVGNKENVASECCAILRNIIPENVHV